MDALKKNPQSSLRSLTLSHLPLPTDFIEGLLPVRPPLTHLTLSHCQMNSHTLVRFFHTLCLPTSVLSSSLCSLDISGNALGQEGSIALGTWLKDRRVTALNSLGLEGTNPDWSSVIVALTKLENGLQSLNIASNTIDEKIFQLLNPFIAHGHVTGLRVGAMKGNMMMVEGLCGSLLLNNSLRDISLNLDCTSMDSM